MTQADLDVALAARPGLYDAMNNAIAAYGNNEELIQVLQSQLASLNAWLQNCTDPQ